MRFGGEKNLKIKLEKSKEEAEEDTDDGCRTESFRLESILPKMAMRVLLVEADDSTRLIISALLLKCSYRVMSSQDSVSTVLKYMLRGAVDFLVKPLRSNELRNLWQHVWRRQRMHGADTTCKAVATLENNVSNYSSDLASSRLKQKECT